MEWAALLVFDRKSAMSVKNPSTDEYPGMPRWVKVVLGFAAVIALLLIVLMLTRSGHGPQRHFGAIGAPRISEPS